LQEKILEIIKDIFVLRTILLIILSIYLSICILKYIRNFCILKTGLLLSHLGIVIIITGSILSNVYGDKGFIWLKEGTEIETYISNQNKKTVKLPFKIQLNNFQIKYDENINNKNSMQQGLNISNYLSEVLITYKDGRNEKYNIKVNSPLKIKGYYIYQASYDPETLKYSGLKIVKDPGLYVVYTGFGFLTSGIIFYFFINPVLIKRRKGKIL
jgi:cytochrome c biogenesis protein ResB